MFVASLTIGVALAGCGSANSTNANASHNGQSGKCPDKHTATVRNEGGWDFDGEGKSSTIDLCASPKLYDGTAVKWAPIKSDILSQALPLNASTREDSADDSTRQCFTNSSGSQCLPQPGDKLQLVCKAAHPNDSTEHYYAVLMTGKLFHPTTLDQAGGSGAQASKTSSVTDFTNAGDIPVGYLAVNLVNTKASLPACSSSLLHDQMSRRQAAMEQGLQIVQ